MASPRLTLPPVSPRVRLPVPGTCQVCGCTDYAACPGGCCWADDSQTLCSSCEDVAPSRGRRCPQCGQVHPGNSLGHTGAPV